MTIELPEDLGSLSDDELAGLADAIQAEGEKLREAPMSDETLAAAELLASQYQQVEAARQERSAAAAERDERVQAALSKIGAAPEGGEEPGGDPEGSVDGAAPGGDPAVVPAAAAAEGATAATQPGSELGIPKDPTPGRVPSADDEAQNLDEPQEAGVPDPTNQPGAPAPVEASAAVAAMTAARPATAAPAPAAAAPAVPAAGRARTKFAELRDVGSVDANTADKVVKRDSLAALVARKYASFGKIATNETYVPIILAHAEFEDYDFQLGTGHEENFSVLRRAQDYSAAVVASGGNCAPLAPSYDVFDIAEPMSPVEAFIPTVGAPRGGIRYVQPPVWTQAQAGVRYTTEAQDAAGYTNQNPAGTTAPKPCVHMACRDIVECEVDAISQCVSFGNLTYRTFPELVEVFLNHLAVAFAQAKEIHYLDAIQAGSTAVNVTPPYGASRGLVYAYALAAHAYRKRNRMPLDAVLDVLLPDTLLPLLKVDMVNDLHLGLSFLTVDAETVARELLSRLGLNVAFYYDFSTTYGSTNALQQAQGSGPLNAFPSLYRSYMYAPGTWVRLDGGTLDVGLIRDTITNSQNDLQIFAEEWNQVCKVGNESLRLDVSLCPSGTGPTPETALSCFS